ncbi:hypothetical protein BDZ97DRAFT_2078780 [Flammula alnicola]|nr:hypothetical protein BDZ97DRAFT_2078780 [Flammula alnicola]
MQDISPADIFGLNRARAAAKSTNLNPRNLEHLWYPFWTRAASRVATQVDSERCTVAPQFPLWRIWTHDDTQLGDITILSEEDDTMDEEDPVAADLFVDDSDNFDDDLDDDNRTISTINETLSIKTRSRITDFAMVYWLESNTVNPHKDDEEDEIFLIDQEFVAALIEIKRAASRKLTGEKLLHAQEILMDLAQRTVFRQALYLFANHRWSNQKSVLAIAAVGDCWTYTVISRKDHLAQTAGADEMNPEWEPDAAGFDAMPWSNVAIWGKAGEDASRVEEVQKWLVEYFLEEEVGI